MIAASTFKLERGEGLARAGCGEPVPLHQSGGRRPQVRTDCFDFRRRRDALIASHRPLQGRLVGAAQLLTGVENADSPEVGGIRQTMTRYHRGMSPASRFAHAWCVRNGRGRAPTPSPGRTLRAPADLRSDPWLADGIGHGRRSRERPRSVALPDRAKPDCITFRATGRFNLLSSARRMMPMPPSPGTAPSRAPVAVKRFLTCYRGTGISTNFLIRRPYLASELASKACLNFILRTSSRGDAGWHKSHRC